jgi:hypothetical protein
LDLHVPAVGLDPPSEDRQAYWACGPDHIGIAAFHASEKRSGKVLPVLRGHRCPHTRSEADLAAGQEFISWMLTQYRRERINHRFRRLSVTKPHQKFTFVHPSDLPLARNAWMVQTRLGLHPSALARFVTWRLQGSGIGLNTGQSMTTSHAHSNWCNVASRAPLRTGLAHFRGIRLSGKSFMAWVRRSGLRELSSDSPRRPPGSSASAPP